MFYAQEMVKGLSFKYLVHIWIPEMEIAGLLAELNEKGNRPYQWKTIEPSNHCRIHLNVFLLVPRVVFSFNSWQNNQLWGLVPKFGQIPKNTILKKEFEVEADRVKILDKNGGKYGYIRNVA